MKKTILNKIVSNLNDKCYFELSLNYKKLIIQAFPNINEKDLIRCELFNGRKIDIYVSVNNEIRYISLKSKGSFSVYKGDIRNIFSLLFSIGMSYSAIRGVKDYLCSYNDKFLLNYAIFLKEDLKDEIQLMKEEFKDKNKILKLIDHFLIKEKNNLCVDYFYFGDERNGELIETCLLVKNILQSDVKGKYMKLGPFNLISLSRENEIEELNKYKCVLKINLYKYKKITENSRLLNNS